MTNPEASDYPYEMPPPLSEEESRPPPRVPDAVVEQYDENEPLFKDDAILERVGQAFEIPSPPATAPAVDMQLPSFVQVAAYDKNSLTWGQWAYKNWVAGRRIENVAEAVAGVWEAMTARAASGSVAGTGYEVPSGDKPVEEDDEDEEEEVDEL